MASSEVSCKSLWYGRHSDSPILRGSSCAARHGQCTSSRPITPCQQEPGLHYNGSDLQHTLPTRQHHLQQRQEVSADVSEYSCGTGKINVHKLIVGVGDSNGRLDSAFKAKTSLQSPLPEKFANEIQRTVNYKKTVAVVEKWDPVVKSNREALHMNFAVQEAVGSLASLQNKVKSFEPLNYIEEQVAAMQANDATIKDKDRVSLETEVFDVNEAKQRRKELVKLRSLMSFREIKHRRMKRIKSKRFHRIQRRCRLSAAKASKQLLSEPIKEEKKFRPKLLSIPCGTEKMELLQKAHQKNNKPENFLESDYNGAHVTHNTCTSNNVWIPKKGWGSWSDEHHKQNQVCLQTRTSNSKGWNKHTLNKQQDKRIIEHMVCTIPWPYKSLRQLENAHCSPLGRHWNTEATFRYSIKPQVIKAVGAAISPIKVTTLGDTN